MKLNKVLLLAAGLAVTAQAAFAAESIAEIPAFEAESYSEDAAGGDISENDAAETESVGIYPEIAGENGITYENFFDVTLAEENYDLWYDCVAAVVGESAAADTVAFMQGYISSDLYGEEAIAYYGENPDATPVFDCFYINGLKLVTFNPDYTITVELEDGSTETHSYEYIGVYPIGAGETMMYMGQEIDMEFPCDVYQSTDEAGEFNYFFLRDDTMETTGHIEFRYGNDLEALGGYFVGPYAYWLTAGFDANANEETLRSTVELFCLENMDYSAHTDEAVAQLDDFSGTWYADLSGWGDEYAGTELYFTIDENGHGTTMMNGVQTADFEAYAFDSGDKGDGVGIYVAYNNEEMEAEAAGYIMEDKDGAAVLTFYADDGVISYVKAEDEAAGAGQAEDISENSDTAASEDTSENPAAEASEDTAGIIEIATAEELAAISENLSGNYVLTADIDLEGAEWTPLGSFVQLGEEGEEAEMPDPEYAFTGTFDGNDHTISNFTITQPEGWCLGLFGCIANASVGDFNIENAYSLGTVMVSNVVGYSYFSTVYDVDLEDGVIEVNATEMSEEGMYGGIVGAGMGGTIAGCSAKADITIPDGTANTGLIGGGLELTSVIGCSSEGTITAGDNCYGLGGISGCGFGSQYFVGNEAEDVTITAGDNCFWVGGITGYTGGFEDESAGVPVTSVIGCSAGDVEISVGENSDGIGSIVGAGFYNPDVAEAYGAPYDRPTVYRILD